MIDPRRLQPAMLFLALLALLTGLPAGAQMGRVSPVGVTEARELSVRGVVVLPGSVEARTRSVVASEVAGLVVELRAREGETVRRGQTIARLRRQTVELDLQAAQAALAEARARLELAERSLERTRELFESGVISRQDLDDAVSESDAWQAQVEQSQAEIARLEDNLEQAVIRAPFTGVVVEEHTEVGQWVAVGGAVVELMGLDQLDVVVQVPERHFPSAREGIEATVRFEALPGLSVTGEISAVIPRADPQARTFPVKIRLDNREGRIAVGMLARIDFPAGEPRPSVVVPKDAIVREGAGDVVWIVETQPEESAEGSDGGEGPREIVRSVPVRVGAGVGAWIAVEGVEAGQRVVTRGNERLFPDARVKPEPVEYELP